MKTMKTVLAVLLSAVLTIPVWAKVSAEQIPGSTKVAAEEVAQMMQNYTDKNGRQVRKVLFIDTRKIKDLKQGGSIPGAVHLNIKKPEKFNLDNILNHPRFISDVLVFCNGHSCTRAQKATQKLLSWKKTDPRGKNLGTIYYFRDGFPSYRDHQYQDGSKNPVVKPY